MLDINSRGHRLLQTIKTIQVLLESRHHSSKMSSNIRACSSTKVSKSGQNSDAPRVAIF